MTDIVDPAIGALRADIAALALRTHVIEDQYATIIALLTELKAGASAGPAKPSFVSKRG
jgi:hypothetical protein